MNKRQPSIRSLALPAGCVVLFLMLGTFNLAHHEMWRDELQHWTISRLSDSPLSLYHNTRYEGTALLWHACLMVITRFTTSPVAMQVLSLCAAASAVAIFVFTSPFSGLQKVLFTASYYPLYEYCTISRPYGMGMAALMLFLAGYPWTGARRWAGVAGLALLAQTSVYGVIVAVAGAVCLMVQHRHERAAHERSLAATAHERRAMTLAVGVLMLVIAFAVVQLKPATDYGIHHSWFKGFNSANARRVIRVGATLWQAVVPIPKCQTEFWNTNLLDTSGNETDPTGITGNIVQTALSVALFALIALAIRRHRAAVWLWFIATGGLMSFFFLKKVGYLRHHGYLYLAALAVLWIVMAQWRRDDQPQPRARRAVSAAVTVVLLVHVGAAVYASVIEYRLPFSASEEAAAWIVDHDLQNDLMTGHYDAYGLTIAMRLDQPFYFVTKGGFFRYGIWNQVKLPFTADQMPDIAGDLQTRHARPILLVMSEPLQGNDTTGRIEQLAQFTNSIEPTERYYLYRLPLPQVPQDNR